MNVLQYSLPIAAALALSACADREADPRGVDHDETLLSVSATGEAEAVPDMAYIEIGVNSYAASARAASDANTKKIEQVLESFKEMGVEDKDTQTRNLSLQKIEYGTNKGRYQASNVLQLRLRQVEKASAIVTAATEVGANVLSGPSLRISDPETANRGAYAAAYKAARSRAEAYADAAGLEIGRVLTIRDGGASYYPRPVDVQMTAMEAGPPPVVAPPPPQEAAIRPGSSLTRVAVQVDFALQAK